jgi:3-hydroxybutyryl-CoA dehydratase
MDRPDRLLRLFGLLLVGVGEQADWRMRPAASSAVEQMAACSCKDFLTHCLASTVIAVQQSLRYFACGDSRSREEHMTRNGNGSDVLGHGYYLEDLSVGMEASVSKKISNHDVLVFAELSGDVNPVHLNDDFAASTIFKKRIAHGFLTGSLFSTVLGTKLPGPGCIYLSQSMKFRAPVYIGDEVVATLKITALDAEKGRATLACICAVNGKPVLEGEAVMMVDRRSPRQ